jgi:hypothetical protein
VHIVHGTWIPEAAGEYVQAGGFYVWIETDAPTRPARASSARIHPRHLTNEALETFLAERLGLLRSAAPVGLALSTRWFLLPSAADAPLPASELLPYVEAPLPAEFELAWWQVCCYRVPEVIST